MSEEGTIGYRKPPKANQFRPGKSGNQGGRPPGSKNLATLIKEAAYDKIVVTSNGVRRKLSRLGAAILQLATKAASGDTKAIADFIELVAGIEEREAATKPSEMQMGDEDLVVLHQVHARMSACLPPPPTATSGET